ncbi:MAG: methionine--tRNA ligase [Candidatus Levyibacteriota bacterium]|nr:MAG: methionine--tRNA ligase [Candidatus Levybacteria bacterium]
MAKFYLTSAIPYVNAKPHIGHALEFVQADVIARYHKIIGDETLYLCGSDENAIKNVQAAEKARIPLQTFIDTNAKLFEDLAKKLGVQFDIFQKGSDKNHHLSSQKLWELCYKNGDIYKKAYTGLYCVGCELFYEKEELDNNGECFEHPGKKLEEVSEENYFFKLSSYKNQIKNLIESNKLKIIPDNRKNEALAFLNQEVKDISISRSNKRAKDWGVQVPNDPTQRMYVWFDALNIYQSGIGFGWNEEKYSKWWPADVQVIGKGILRFHAIYWPAFLLSAKLPVEKSILVHEYITINGQKMSKTLGNVIDPLMLIEKYGTDPLRYYFLHHISPFIDGDFSEDKFKEVYNADLANGLGNLVARVAKLCEINDFKISERKLWFNPGVKKFLEEFKFNDALASVWELIAELNKEINDKKLWELSKEKAEPILKEAVEIIQLIGYNIQPFLPETAKKIQEQFKGPKITSKEGLFPRIV